MDENKIIIELVKNRPSIYIKGKCVKDKEKDWEEIKNYVENLGLKVQGILIVLYLYFFLKPFIKQIFWYLFWCRF